MATIPVFNKAALISLLGDKLWLPLLPGSHIYLREYVIVETRQGFNLAKVKFIGETKFAPGEWIGVGFVRPIGKNNGTVNGVQYFRCKDKRGKFIQRDKIIPASSPATI